MTKDYLEKTNINNSNAANINYEKDFVKKMSILLESSKRNINEILDSLKLLIADYIYNAKLNDQPHCIIPLGVGTLTVSILSGNYQFKLAEDCTNLITSSLKSNKNLMSEKLEETLTKLLLDIGQECL